MKDLRRSLQDQGQIYPSLRSTITHEQDKMAEPLSLTKTEGSLPTLTTATPDLSQLEELT